MFEQAVLGTDTDDFYDITLEELYAMMSGYNTQMEEKAA